MGQTIHVTITLDALLRHAVELTDKRDGEDVWQRQARGLDELGYAIVRKDDPPAAGDGFLSSSEDTSTPNRCGRCGRNDMAHLGGGYYECRGCGHGWDGPYTDAPADIR
jgi:hypothetical protein